MIPSTVCENIRFGIEWQRVSGSRLLDWMLQIIKCWVNEKRAYFFLGGDEGVENV
jgi:hypothetical protein